MALCDTCVMAYARLREELALVSVGAPSTRKLESDSDV